MANESEDADQESAMQSALAFAMRGDFSKLGSIVSALENVERGVRLEASYCCKRIGFSGASQQLCRMALSDTASENRAQAIYGLGGIGRPSAIPTIAKGLDDAEDEVREAARTVLYRMVGPEVLPMLGDEGDDRDSNESEVVERWWSIRAPHFDSGRAYALGELASPMIFIGRLEEAAGVVPSAYLNLLHDWTGEDFGSSPVDQVIARWQDWWKMNHGNYLPGIRYFYGHLVP
jgi:hypothetical protein